MEIPEIKCPLLCYRVQRTATLKLFPLYVHDSSPGREGAYSSTLYNLGWLVTWVKPYNMVKVMLSQFRV